MVIRRGNLNLLKFCSVLALLLLLGGSVPLCAQQKNKNQAVNLFEQGYYTGAIGLLEPLYGWFPKDPEINFYYGASLVESHADLQKAVKILTEASLSNEFIQSYFYLGKAYLLQYQFDEAKKQFQRFQKQADKKMLKSYNVGIYLKACEIAPKMILDASQIDSRNIDQLAISDLANKLLIATGSHQLLDESLKSKADQKLPQGFSLIQSKLKEEVYFSSYRGRGKNGQDLVFTFKDKKGKWNKAKGLAGALLSSHNEINPVISPDGKDLYFCSNGEGTMGGYDVFKSSFDSEKQQWTKPINLGYPINTPFDDFLFIPDFENNTALLASNRECNSDSAWLIELDLTSVREAGEIADHPLFSLFSEKEETRLTKEMSLFQFPGPGQQSKSSFPLLLEEAEEDEILMTDYRNFLEMEIDLSTGIADSKQKTSLKKRKDADNLKASVSTSEIETERTFANKEYEQKMDSAQQLNEEAEFTYSYIIRLKRYQKIVEELSKLAYRFRNALSQDDDLPAQWHKLKSQRSNYNQSILVFIPIEQEIKAKQKEYSILQEELIASAQEIDKIREANLAVEKKLVIKEREVFEDAGGNQDQLLTLLAYYHRILNEGKIKLDFSQANYDDIKSQADKLEVNLKMLLILNEELLDARGEGFDFSSYYTEQVADTNKNLQAAFEADEMSGSSLIYDFSGVSERKVLTKVQFDKKEQKAFARAFSFEKKAEKIGSEIHKLQDRHKNYELTAANTKAGKLKNVRKKQKKINRKIEKRQLKKYHYQQQSWGLKYPILESMAKALQAESSLKSDPIELMGETSKRQWELGNRQWKKAAKAKNIRVGKHAESIALIDSSYTGLLNTMSFYLGLLPEPTQGEVLPEPEINTEPEIPPEEEMVEEDEFIEPIVEELANLDLYYSVQVGAYKTDETPAQLRDIPDLFAMPAPQNIFRFSTGKFATESEAADHKTDMQSAGVPDAFVVAYFEDERISLSKARNLVAEAKPEKMVADANGVIELPSDEETFYTVQIGIFGRSPDFEKWPVADQIFNKKMSSGLTKYTYGQFPDYSSAKSAQDKIRKSGIPDAFVIKVEQVSLASVSEPVKPVQSTSNRAAQNSEIKSIKEHQVLFYSVQIGAYKQGQHANRFQGLNPLYYYRTSNFYKYFAGIFSSIEEAISARNQIRSASVPDAYVVAFYQGENISIEKAKNISGDNSSQKEPAQKITVTEAKKETPGVNNPVGAQSQKKAEELFYTIQIGIYSARLSDLSEFKVEPLYQFPAGEKYKLTCGRYGSYESAKTGKQTAMSAGYLDAYIIAYYQGENISLNEAAGLSVNPESVIFANEKKVKIRTVATPSSQRSGSDEIEYRIQIASFRDPAAASVLASYKKLAGDYGLRNYSDKNGMVVYTVGNFKTYSEAMKVRKILIENNAPGAFIIAFRGVNKIPVNVAIQITEQN